MSSEPTILIVDDDQPTRDLYCRIFEPRYHVVTCADRTSALRALDGTGIGLVVLEPELPNESGWQLLDDIRRLPAHPTLPVVLCSSSDCRPRGSTLAAAALIKPVLPALLLDLAGRLIVHPAA